MNILDEAVDAAAMAIYQVNGFGESGFELKDYRPEARAALTAAVPYMFAAIEEAVGDLGHEEWCDAYTSHNGACRCLKARMLEILSMKPAA